MRGPRASGAQIAPRGKIEAARRSSGVAFLLSGRSGAGLRGLPRASKSRPSSGTDDGGGMVRTLLLPFTLRPRLSAALALGVVLGAALVLIPNALKPSTRAIFAWDGAMALFILTTFRMMSECDDSRIRARAAQEDEGQHFILGLAIVAAFFSIVAVAAELTIAKTEHGLAKGLRVALAFVTVLASWVFVQIIFALHYAHEYYAELEEEGDEAIKRGLHFPGDDTPDYWDFFYFGSVIGVANQTADVSFASKSMRRTGMVHGLVSFVFNTVVLALTINLLAGLF